MDFEYHQTGQIIKAQHHRQKQDDRPPSVLLLSAVKVVDFESTALALPGID